MFHWEDFRNFCFESYPSLGTRPDSFHPTFFSPFHIPLARTHVEKIRRFVSASFALREIPAYQARVFREHPEFSHPRHASAVMSYDFHVTEAGPRLIEINTNAGMFLGLDLLYRYYERRGQPHSFPDAREALFRSFLREHRDNTGQDLIGAELAIMDEALAQQDLYCEFLMYRDFFRERGVHADICDLAHLAPAAPESSEVGAEKKLELRAGRLWLDERPIDFIYNRATDFYFSSPHAAALKQSYLAHNRTPTISPNPHEYLLLATKSRLIEWQDENFWSELGLAAPTAPLAQIREDLLAALIPSFLVSTRSVEQVWAERKKYFFKPLESFGGKAAYAGKSVSRKVFEHITGHPYIAQELTPPPHFTGRDNAGQELEFKYDVRVYAYRDQIQLIGARLYQGQTTNFRSPYGGFAPVTISD